MSAVTTSIGDDFAQLAADGAVSNQAFASLDDSGAAAVRFPVRWDEIEQADGALHWDSLEDLRRQLVLRGQKAIPVIVGCSRRWIDEGQAGRDGKSLSYPTGHQALNAFADFAIETIRFFAQFGAKLDAIEVWSEPDVATETSIVDPDAFGRLVTTVAASVQSAQVTGLLSGSITVVSGALRVGPRESRWREYVNTLCTRHPYGAYSFGLHPVPAATGRERTTAAYARALASDVQAAVEQFARTTNSDIWVTGVSASSATPSGEAGQEAALTKIIEDLLQRKDVAGVSVSQLYPGSSGEDDVSLVRADGSNKRAVSALRSAWSQA